MYGWLYRLVTEQGHPVQGLWELKSVYALLATPCSLGWDYILLKEGVALTFAFTKPGTRGAVSAQRESLVFLLFTPEGGTGYQHPGMTFL